MEMYAYDIEVFRNYFLVVIIDVEDYFRIRNTIDLDTTSVKEFKEAVYKVAKYVYQIGHGVNQIMEIVAFFNRNIILASFNGLDYDNVLINACILNVNNWKSISFINATLYNLSKRVISNQNAGINNDPKVTIYKYAHTLYSSIDVQKVFGLNKIYKSLKQTLINLKWFNIEDFEMPPVASEEEASYYKDYELEGIKLGHFDMWDRYIMLEHLTSLYYYCNNDTLGVCEILYQKKDDIVYRFEASRLYGVDLLSSSKSNIADRVFGKLYCDAANVEFKNYKLGRTERKSVAIAVCIPSYIRFQSDTLNEMLKSLKTKVIFNTKGDLKFTIDYGGTIYKLATGGLHSVDKPGKFDTTDDAFIVDADVTSYYPNIVRNNKIAPAHLNHKIFIDTTSGIINDRIEAKANKNMTVANTLKIVINVGVFGKFGYDESPVKDVLAMVKVTIAGQLSLLMLIESLFLQGIKTISANTDGIVCIVPNDKADAYYNTCKEWEAITNLNLEYTYYERYIRKDVNNYMALKVGDSPVEKRMKYKGSFNPNLYKEDLTKGYKNPVVAQAVYNYYFEDTPIMDTLKNNKNILDFCATQKPNSKYNLELHHIVNGVKVITQLSKDVRFYVSTSNKLLFGLLLKNDKSIDKNENRKYTNVVSGKNVTIFNKRVDFDNFDDYSIDYGYYYAEAKKIIVAVESGTTNKRKIKKEYGQYKMEF